MLDEEIILGRYRYISVLNLGLHSVFWSYFILLRAFSGKQIFNLMEIGLLITENFGG